MKEKIAVWVSQQRGIPYRFRKSFIKKLCPHVLTNYQFEVDFYGMKYAGNTNDSTDRLFFMFGGCERYMLSMMRDYYKAIGKDDFTFIDIGAHVGNHSLFMSKYAKQVHAFEPNPQVRDSLNRKINANNIKNITVHPFGLSNRNASIPFYVSKEDHLSCGSFRADHDERNEYYGELEVRVGDEVAKQSGINNADIIKIDVEGFERESIEGLRDIIATSRPLIIAEISASTRRSFGSKDDFESIFPKDYYFYQFSGVSREGDDYKIALFDYNEHGHHLDVIAIPKEKLIYLSDKITNRLERSKVVGGET